MLISLDKRYLYILYYYYALKRFDQEMEYILLIFSWVSFLHIVLPVRIPQNPCPPIFSYYKDANGLLYGETTIPYDNATFMTLSINASLAGQFNKKVELKLQLKTPLKKLMANVNTVTYNIDFPSQKIIPKITQITYNGVVYCKGPPEPLIPGTQGITNVWYSTTFQFSRIPQWNFIEDHQDPGIPESEVPFKDPNNIVYTTRIPENPEENKNNSISHSTVTIQEIVNEFPSTTPAASKSEEMRFSCGVAKPMITPLILGGIDTAVGQYPWLVAVMSKKDSSNDFEYKCSATLISDKHVITAGRCVQYYKLQVLKTSNILLVMGTNDLRNWAANGAVTRKSIKVDTHPDYLKDPNTAHADVSVITIDIPVKFSNLLIPVCLWKGNSDLYPVTDRVGTVVGYGQDEAARQNGALHVSRAKYADMRIISQYNCLSSEIGLLHITSDKTFCAGGASKGPCIGDSGAGFVLKINGIYQLRGIASYSVTQNGTCEFKNKYAVFCDVAKFSDWIESCMEN